MKVKRKLSFHVFCPSCAGHFGKERRTIPHATFFGLDIGRINI